MIAVGIPSDGPPTWELLQSMLTLQMPGPWEFRRFIGYMGVDAARDSIVCWFLDSDHEWLLQVDSDAVLHPGTVLRLLSWGRPIVGALALTRYFPVKPTIYLGEPGRLKADVAGMREWILSHPDLWKRNQPVLLEPRPDDALVEVGGTGCHCLLCHRDVFEVLEPPWFQRKEDQPDAGGEDFYFFDRAREAGYPVCVDRSVLAGHLAGPHCIGALDFLAWDGITDWEAKEIRPNG